MINLKLQNVKKPFVCFQNESDKKFHLCIFTASKIASRLKYDVDYKTKTILILFEIFVSLHQCRTLRYT